MDITGFIGILGIAAFVGGGLFLIVFQSVVVLLALSSEEKEDLNDCHYVDDGVLCSPGSWFDMIEICTKCGVKK